MFAGYRHDPETHLYSIRNRNYHPTLGRWLERDPEGYIDGMSMYQYCGGRPTGATDPMGLAMLDVLGNALESDWDYACEQAEAVADDIAYGADRFASGVCERACYLGELFQDAFSDPMCVGGGPWTDLNAQLIAVRDQMGSDVWTFVTDICNDPHALGAVDEGNTHFWYRLNRDPKQALWDDFLLPQLTGLARRVEAVVRDPKEGGKLTVDLLALKGIGEGLSVAGNELMREARVLFWKSPGKAAGAGVGAGVRPPVRGAVRTNGRLVQDIGTRAEAWGVRQELGRGPVAGRLKHGYADRLLTRYQRMFGDRALTTEVRYFNGRPWQAGDPLKGSIRLDVVEGPLGKPTAVWDYNCGDSWLGPTRINQIRTGAGLGPTVPVEPVRAP